MGQTSSNFAKKVGKWALGDNSNEDQQNTKCMTRPKFNPFVYQRPSCMYIDVDGDIAHEFYEQRRVSFKTPNSKKRKTKVIMCKIPPEELRPVGMEELSHPSINVNYPLILCEASMIRPT
ncbi:tumor suppressor candidate 2-like [Watersipora subatra]|uniref:tumor suppressor candidate 2-like n=1 Tax=Watersipora subatra TaxID=2589382 RepID=UPI00355B9302